MNDRRLAHARTEASYSLDSYHRAHSRRQAAARAGEKRTWHRVNRRFARVEIAASLEPGAPQLDSFELDAICGELPDWAS